MVETQNKNPLHGITLEKIITELQTNLGWQKMGGEINIKCFTTNPTVKSSLVFLRRTPWARTKVEKLYLDFLNGRIDRSIQPKRKQQDLDEKEMYPDLEL